VTLDKPALHNPATSVRPWQAHSGSDSRFAFNVNLDTRRSSSTADMQIFVKTREYTKFMLDSRIALLTLNPQLRARRSPWRWSPRTPSVRKFHHLPHPVATSASGSRNASQTRPK
jgi:hypothetical protein